MRLNTQIERANRKIFYQRDVVSNDETLVFADASGRLAFIRHDYVDEGDEIGASHAVVIGGHEPLMLPLMAVPTMAVTLHQGADGLPPLDSPAMIDTAAAERLWRDRRGSDVVIGRTEEGILRAVTTGGSEPEYPCMSRGTGAVLTLGGGRFRSELNEEGVGLYRGGCRARGGARFGNLSRSAGSDQRKRKFFRLT